MPHYHSYVANPLGDPHFLICANRKHGCAEPYIRDVLYNCGACPWCKAHPRFGKPDPRPSP